MKPIKFKKIRFNNRARTFIFFYRNGKEIEVHYAQFGIKRHISRADLDKETSGYTCLVVDTAGKRYFIPYDQPLALIQDPEFVLQSQIENIVANLNRDIRESHISKRSLARQMGTSLNQLSRLLDPSIPNKNLIQLYLLGSLIGAELELRYQKKSA